MNHLEAIDHRHPQFGDLYDELLLWSAPFGLRLLDRVSRLTSPGGRPRSHSPFTLDGTVSAGGGRAPNRAADVEARI